MKARTFTFALALVGLVLTAGCMTPWSRKPWYARSAERSPPAERTSNGPTAGRSSLGERSEREQSIEELLVGLRRDGAFDEEKLEILRADLNEIPVNMWPNYIRQVRATLAYAGAAKEGLDSGQPDEREDASFAGAHEKVGGFSESGNRELPLVRENPPSDQYKPTISSRPSPEPASLGSRSTGQLPSRGNTMIPVSHTSSWDRRALGSASGEEPAEWQRHAALAASALEAKLANLERAADESGSPTAGIPQEVLAGHAQLRLLYLLAGQRNDAYRPMPSSEPALADFWSKEIHALEQWLDTSAGAGSASERALRVKESLDRAVARLGAAAPLAVRNLAFCTDIRSFGNIKRFDNYDFAPGQEVLLYAEVDNYTVQSTGDGYRTELAISYEVFDRDGRPVGEHEFPSSEDSCGSPRRDFYVMCRFQLPERMYPGKHTLVLKLEDLLGNKFGESSIEFDIVASKQNAKK